jgi:predicted nuclease of predicted toxin-antitoxin system
MPARTTKSVLLDHCVPKPLKNALTGFTVRHTSELRWHELEDDDLLKAAEAQFDVLVTTDQNMRYQQNLSQFNIGVIVLVAFSNRLESLLPLVPDLLTKLRRIKPGELIEIQ